MASKSKKITIGTKVLPEELRAMKSVATRLGYKNMSQWLESLLRKAYTEAISKLLDQEPQNESVQPPTATA